MSDPEHKKIEKEKGVTLPADEFYWSSVSKSVHILAKKFQ